MLCDRDRNNPEDMVWNLDGGLGEVYMLLCPTNDEIAKPSYPEYIRSQEFISVPSFPGGSLTSYPRPVLTISCTQHQAGRAVTPYQGKGRRPCDD